MKTKIMNMTKRSILSATILCSASLLSAQEIRFGGGYNGSNVSRSGEEQWAGRAGYQFGAEVVLGERWFVKSGVHLFVRNLDYTIATEDAPGNNPADGTEFRYTERSLKVPVHVGRRLLDPENDPSLNIYVFGGPSAVLNLNADLNNDALEVRAHDAQWYAGFGGGLELSFLFAEVGYDIAMSNVFKGQGFRTNPRINNVFASIGVRLRLAR